MRTFLDEQFSDLEQELKITHKSKNILRKKILENTVTIPKKVLKNNRVWQYNTITVILIVAVIIFLAIQPLDTMKQAENKVSGSNEIFEPTEVEINENFATQAELKTEIENNDFLNSFNKVDVALKEESPNSYYFKENMDLHNGDLFLLNRKNNGLHLKKGDYVEIDLSMIPDGFSHTVVGYILDGKYTETFSEPVTDKLITSFEVDEDGEYIICIIGANANFITITGGVISIN
ncbi:hypothetical protein [Psychrobacillus sp. NPDC093180]|uniref:hypothetical protein n=1 Tax=Psychrobacillus sp. NPDC093180 TaxID=3364489 RepID=UPI0037F21780